MTDGGDPSTRTIAQLEQAVHSVRELFEARFAGHEEAVSFYKPQVSIYFLQNVAVSATIRLRALSARKVIA